MNGLGSYVGTLPRKTLLLQNIYNVSAYSKKAHAEKEASDIFLGVRVMLGHFLISGVEEPSL